MNLDMLDISSDYALIVNALTICLSFSSFPLLTCHFIYRYLAIAK